MYLSRAALAVLAIGFVGSGVAQAKDCRMIERFEQRRACYDTLFSSRQSAPTDEDRTLYRGELERAFLSAGFNFDVMLIAPRTLMIYGPLTKALVYQLLARTVLLQRAKSLGFKRLDFTDSITVRRWFFDLSGGTLPNCDEAGRLCLR